ncbi:MAG: hypothetical protein GX271_01315 [Clostridiales bacterium]|nr:hypothetical protein [Clostridiales bacterium]
MMKNKYFIITASSLFIIVAGVCYSCSYSKDPVQEILLSSDNNIEEDEALKSELQVDNNLQIEDELIYVHICGAVVSPAVYQVKDGTRLVELIEYAGGLLAEAADDYINQAVVVEDGQRIYIPTKDELKELKIEEYVLGDIKDQSDNELSKKVNINTADEAELMGLPGIGQAKAKSIIDYRNKNGEFEAITDLMKISGIKDGLFAQLEDLIIVK